MAYSNFLIVQVEGNTIKDLVLGCDGIAASLERGEMERTAEAPSKTGRYTYIASKASALVSFEGIQDMIQKNISSEQVIESLKDEIKTLKDQLKKATAEAEGEEEEEEEPKVEEKKPEPKSKPKTTTKPKRMRTY